MQILGSKYHESITFMVIVEKIMRLTLHGCQPLATRGSMTPIPTLFPHLCKSNDLYATYGSGTAKNIWLLTCLIPLVGVWGSSGMTFVHFFVTIQGILHIACKVVDSFF